MSAPLNTDADRWMDREDARPRNYSVQGLIAPAMELPRRFLKFISTTPGLFTLASILLITAILAAGGAMALSSSWRQDELNNLVSRAEPLSNSSQELFNSLSLADSAATSEFLEPRGQDRTPERNYERHINTATQELIKATSGIKQVDSREMELVMQLQASLPRYVQLVTQAVDNDRFRNPVGASYLTQASHLMQDEMLPAAEELYALTSEQVSAQQREVIKPMWFPLSGLIAAVVLLLIAQARLAAHTNRVFNVGHLTATAFMLIALLVAGVSATWTWNAGNQWIDSSVGPLESLTQQRIAAQQVRTSEALGLVQRNYGDQPQEEFTRTISQIDEELEVVRDQVLNPEPVDIAREHLKEWDAAHAVMVYELQHGNFRAATDAALGTDSASEDGAAEDEDAHPDLRTSYTLFDEQLQGIIKDSRTKLQSSLTASQRAAQNTAAIVASMTILAAIATGIGTRPRVREYL